MVTKRECELCKMGLVEKIDAVREDIAEMKSSQRRWIAGAVAIATLIIAVLQYLRV